LPEYTVSHTKNQCIPCVGQCSMFNGQLKPRTRCATVEVGMQVVI
jgi:hypothetical protein